MNIVHIEPAKTSEISCILVTGGLGFIGSHVVVKLALRHVVNPTKKALHILILDNLSNSDPEVLKKINDIVTLEFHRNNIISELNNNITFLKGDIRDSQMLDHIFTTYQIEYVMHFAALKSVSESQKYPDLYNEVNVEGTKNLLNVMKSYGCKKIVYSSSATVYGDAPAPVNEDTKVGQGLACNYARNKYDMERYLIENSVPGSSLADWRIVILRYFNPIGAHPSGLIGENPNDIPNNVFPYLLRVAKWINTDHSTESANTNISPYEIFTVFGNDYLTRDGTCIRDYVHVQDLAKSHVDVLGILEGSESMLKIYNVGTGKGSTVMELIDAMNRALNARGKAPLPYRIGARRTGDLDISFADVKKIYNEIGFKAEFDIDKMCEDGLNFIGL